MSGPPQQGREDAVGPVIRRLVEATEQLVDAQRLGVDACLAVDRAAAAVRCAADCLQQALYTSGLANPGRADDHQTRVETLQLI